MSNQSVLLLIENGMIIVITLAKIVLETVKNALELLTNVLNVRLLPIVLIKILVLV